MSDQSTTASYPVANDSSEAAENASRHLAEAAQAASEGRVGDAVSAGLDAVKDAAQSFGHMSEGN